MLPSWTRRLRFPVGTKFGGSEAPTSGYGWWAYTSNFFIPYLCAALRNVSGSTEGRVVVGASFPFGPVTPHASCSPGKGPRNGEWMPL